MFETKIFGPCLVGNGSDGAWSPGPLSSYAPAALLTFPNFPILQKSIPKKFQFQGLFAKADAS